MRRLTAVFDHTQGPWAVLLVGVIGVVVPLGNGGVAVADSGVAISWGSRDSWGLGSPETSKDTPTPVVADRALTGKKVTDIAVSSSHSCAVADGRVHCWGYSEWLDQFSRPPTDADEVPIPLTYATEPTLLPGQDVLKGEKVTDISISDNGGCLVAAGKAFCWGSNDFGRLGIGNKEAGTHDLQPVDVSGVLAGLRVSSVEAKETSTCAIAEGRAFCWGQIPSNSRQATSPTPLDLPGALAGKTVDFIQLTGPGAEHCLVADGRAYCADFTGNYVPLVPARGPGGGTKVSALAAGLSMAPTCAVAGGWVYCGTVDLTQRPSRIDLPAVKRPRALRGKTVTQVAVASRSVCFIAGGRAYCRGRLPGNGPASNGGMPVAVKSERYGDKSVSELAVSDQHRCLVAAGRAVCWGYNGSGQVGTGQRSGDERVPVRVGVSGVLRNRGVSDIDAGRLHACAVAQGRLFCWGRQTGGELGIRRGQADRESPVPVTQIPRRDRNKVSAVSAGSAYTCAVAGGRLYCSFAFSPRRSETLWPRIRGGLRRTDVTSVSVGGGYACAVADGKGYCWGYRSRDRLDRAPRVLTGVLRGKRVTSVSAGTQWYGHSCAVASGRAYCWGNNDRGQLGNATTSRSDKPVAVDMSGTLKGRTVTAVSAGGSQSCAIADGSAFCWGQGNMLGTGRTADSAVPVEVEGLRGTTVTDIDVGNSHTCAVATGEAFCWGSNSHGQLGDGTNADSSVPVRVRSEAGPKIAKVRVGGDFPQGWFSVALVHQ